ncbi:MAG: hypothetical protein J6V76_02360 [Bacteroidales bacterium]|nr:hypothetical protein [Bacteroidales bacterium]
MERFNFKRLVKVMRSDLCELGGALLILAIFMVLMVILYDLLFAIFILDSEPIRNLTNFTIYVALTSSVAFPCAIFYNLNKPARAVPYITLPATSFEKYVSRVFLFWFVPLLFAFVMFWFLPHTTPVDDTVSSFTNIWRAYRLRINCFIAMSALMILGSAFFKKGAFGKVAAIVAVVLIAVLCVFAQFRHGIKEFANNYIPQWVADFANYIEAEHFRISVFQLSCSFALVAIALVVAYYRFKRFTLKS